MIASLSFSLVGFLPRGSVGAHNGGLVNRASSMPLGAPAPQSTLSWLHTNGTQILDSMNQPVIFHGINHTGMEVGTGLSVNQQSGGWRIPSAGQYTQVAAWHFNVARIPISWSNLEPRAPVRGPSGALIHQFNQTYLAALDSIVQQYSMNHVYVIIDMHQWNWSPVFTSLNGMGQMVLGNGMPTWLYPNASQTITSVKLSFYHNDNGVQDSFSAVWQYVAARYANNPAVAGFDLLNEPNQGTNLASTDMQLDALYAKVGAAIRAVNSHALLIFEGTGSSDHIMPVSGPPPFSNTVYSIHFYPHGGWTGGNTWLFNNYAKAQSWNVPFWVGEFGEFGTGGDTWKTQEPLFTAYCKQNNIGWAFWAYSGAPVPLYNYATNADVAYLVQILESGL